MCWVLCSLLVLLAGTGATVDDPLVYLFGSFNVPNPAKADKGGEDAFFVHRSALGVADGVGGWALQNVDPAAYARALVSGSFDAVNRDQLRAPVPLMWAGYQKAHRSSEPASSTFCVVSLISCARLAADRRKLPSAPGGPNSSGLGAGASDGAPSSRVLSHEDQAGCPRADREPDQTVVHAIANLGDSGAIVFRLPPPGSEGRGVELGSSADNASPVAVQTEEQQHDFNFPFQLGADSADLPSDAVRSGTPAVPGDLVLVATDGLFDNVYPEEIWDHVRPVQRAYADSAHSLSASASSASDALYQLQALLSQAAHDLASLANARGGNETFLSPFAQSAQKAGWPVFKGGKLDDVTVVLGLTIPTTGPFRPFAEDTAHRNSGAWLPGTVVPGRSSAVVFFLVVSSGLGWLFFCKPRRPVHADHLHV